MLKVLKNLKKSWSSVLIIVILLCIQASTDLAFYAVSAAADGQCC